MREDMENVEQEIKATAAAQTEAEVKEQEQPATEDQVSAEGDDTVAQLQSELAALQAQLKSEQEQAKAALESMARAAAESDNRRKRAEADVERERKYGNEKILKAMLPVVDSLELALQHTDKNNELLKGLYEGVENTLSLFLKELNKFGVAQLNPVGEPFDPNLHQAVTMLPSNEVKPNHVLSVLQKGFVLNGRVVRPAMVAVAKATEPVKKDEAQQNTVNLEA